MKKIILMLGLLLMLTGCIPLQQSEITGTRQFEYLSADEGYFMEQLGPSDQAKQKKIIAIESYVISPKNKRYAVELQPHDYDLSEHFPYIRDHECPVSRLTETQKLFI